MMTALQLIKSRDATQALVLFMRSDEAMRVISAWPTLGARDVDRPLKKNEDYHEASESLWSKARESLSVQELADQAEVPLTRCEKTLQRLIRAGIIYPDGTISPRASDLLVATAIGEIKRQRPRGK